MITLARVVISTGGLQAKEVCSGSVSASSGPPIERFPRLEWDIEPRRVESVVRAVCIPFSDCPLDEDRP